jgi:hypothetical protein
MSVEVGAPYLPFMDGPRTLDASSFRWRLGLRPLDLHDWIEFGGDADDQIASKPGIEAAHADTVFAALDGIDDESDEVAAALLDHLRGRWPDRYADARLDANLHPLRAAARLVPEDLVLMVERDGRLVFAAGSVCFPNRWDLRSKIGCSMAEVHAPVALLNDQLGHAVDQFFERLHPDRSFWRLGWGVLDTDERYTPTDGTAPPRPPSPPPSELFLRVERETLRRFPRTGAVLFTIRTHITPIPDMRREPAVATRLADALDALPGPVQQYKDVTSTAPALVRYLRGAVDISRT